MIRAIDIAKLAGLIEGEGCLSLVRHKPREDANIPRLDLWSTDRDVIEWAARLLGQSVYGPYPPGKARPNKLAIIGRKPLFSVVAQGSKAAAWLMTLYVLLHGRRKARIRQILSAWKITTVQRGHVLNLWQYARGGKGKLIPSCHPNKQHMAFGLCQMCYQRQRRANGLR